MNVDFYTTTHSFRRMEFSEIKQLAIGDEVCIGILDIPNKANFIKATVVQPLFWNSDADEPDWEVETTNGFVDVYSIYEVVEL